MLDLRPRQLRKTLAQFLSLCMVFTSAYMVYRTLGVVANTDTPAVVVLSGSMEPAFQRGDILFLWNANPRVDVGDVVVYDTKRRSIPIVHRVVHEHRGPNKQLVLTKGDNNPLNDLDLYEHKQMYLDRDRDINGGMVWGYIPKLGYATIKMAEDQRIKMLFLGGALVLHLLQNE